MSRFPIFLSVVITMRNHSGSVKEILEHSASAVSALVSDYELIVVDNASDDNSVSELKKITGSEGLPNIQVFALTKEVDIDTASWVGLENALGDYVAVIDPLVDDIAYLPELLEGALAGEGVDVVFASNRIKAAQPVAYRAANMLFYGLYKTFSGVDLGKVAPQYRLLSRRLVNFILQHPQPSMTYRHLPATGGFSKVNLEYASKPKAASSKRLGNSIDRGSRLLVSTSRGPMRIVTTLSLFGAVANLFYSVYVLAVGLFKSHVAEGWVSTSLQQSGMFFLISMVLMVLGEYILSMASTAQDGPPYYIGQEFTSARMTRREKLNLEVMETAHEPVLAERPAL